MGKIIWDVSAINMMVKIVNEEIVHGLGLQAIADKRFMKADGSTVNESTIRTAFKKRGWKRVNGKGLFSMDTTQTTKSTTDMYSHDDIIKNTQNTETTKYVTTKNTKTTMILESMNTNTFKKILDKQDLLLEFLEKFESNKKVEESLGNIKIEFDSREETKVTSIRVYARALEEFNEVFSKQNVFTRQECISQALLDFANKLKK